MNSQLISITAAPAASMAIAVLVTNAVHKPPEVDEDDGTLTLHYGAMTRIVPITSALLLVAVLSMPLWNPLTTWAKALPGSAFLAVLLVPPIFEVRTRTVVTRTTVTTTSTWHGTRLVDWDQVARIDFAWFAGWFVLRDEAGRKVRVPGLCSGIPHFAAMLESMAPGKAGERAAARWRANVWLHRVRKGGE